MVQYNPNWSLCVTQRVHHIDYVLTQLLGKQLLRREDLEGKVWRDLGTGRGVGAYCLGEHGAHTVGVDHYEEALNEGIGYGLLTPQTAIADDVLRYITSLEEKSIDGVSAFR